MKKENKINKKNKEKKTKISSKKLFNQSAKGSYLKGILGAVLGGAIASIPWILTYVYGGMILSVLAIVISICAYFGYKWLGGKINKMMPVILSIVLLVIISVVVFVIVPVMLLNLLGTNVTFETFTKLYNDAGFVKGIVRDCLISVAFGAVGIGTLTLLAKIQTEDENMVSLETEEDLENLKKEAMKKIKPVFEKYNAFVAKTGIEEKELDDELLKIKDSRIYLQTLKNYKIIRKRNGKYYYDIGLENSKYKKKKKVTLIGITSIIVIVISLVLAGYTIYKNLNSKEAEQKTNRNIINDSQISATISDKWNYYEYEYLSGYNYYRYINTIPSNFSNQESTEDDYSSLPAYASINNYDIDNSIIPDIESLEKSIKESYASGEEGIELPSTLETTFGESANGYKTLKIKVIYSKKINEVEILYYIWNGNKLGSIDLFSFNLDDEKDLENESKKIVDSFKWNN